PRRGSGPTPAGPRRKPRPWVGAYRRRFGAGEASRVRDRGRAYSAPTTQRGVLRVRCPWVERRGGAIGLMGRMRPRGLGPRWGRAREDFSLQLSVRGLRPNLLTFQQPREARVFADAGQVGVVRGLVLAVAV